MPRRKKNVFDHVEEIFMEADAPTFLQLEERVATIKRLRKLDRKTTLVIPPKEIPLLEALK